MDVPVKKAQADLTMRTPPRTGKAETKPTTLLDVHDVEWITRELERLLAKERSGGDDDDACADAGRHRRKRDKAILGPKKGGFMAELLERHAVSICCGDAVDSASAAAAIAGVDRGRRLRRRGSGFREVEKV